MIILQVYYLQDFFCFISLMILDFLDFLDNLDILDNSR